MITWEQLTEGEQNALSRWINIDREFVNEFEKGLQAKGLIRIVRIDHHRHQNMLTDAGRAVLAQAASGQPEAVNRGKPSSLFFDETELIDDSMPSTQPEAEGEDDDIDMRTMSDDDLQRTIDQLPAIRAQYAMEEELATLRAQLAASLEREAALRAALEKVKGVSDSYSGADIPHIANPKRALYEAESVFNEIAQALADAGEIAAEALASNGGERGGK